MSEFDDTKPSDSVLGDILARTGTFKLRVAKLPGGGFGVFADQFLIENYATEDQAKALCNRLSREQSREIQKISWKWQGIPISRCKTIGLNMLEPPHPIFSSAAISAIAANEMFHFHVESLPTGEFCVYADTFPIEDYPTAIEAKALCKRLIAQHPVMVARASVQFVVVLQAWQRRRS
jgi:hypothetical protein